MCHRSGARRHVLLSFAQFEREIISERTRDKQSAARRKGRWTGGYPVLGYDADPSRGRLLVNEREAAQIREIFGLFLRDGSLDSTLAEMQQRGWQMKSWTTRKGQPHVGQTFDRAGLVRLLTNVLYCGECAIRGRSIPASRRPSLIGRSGSRPRFCCGRPRAGSACQRGRGRGGEQRDGKRIPGTAGVRAREFRWGI